jgi:RHS repeat-associated protein
MKTEMTAILRFAVLIVALGLAAGDARALYCTTTTTPCDPNDPKSACYVPPPPSAKCQPQSGPGFPTSCTVCKKCTTSPVFAASGVYEVSATDLRLPTSGFPLEAARYYSSVHAIDGPTGFGWSSSFHARLHYATYLYAAPSTYQREAEVIMPDGNHYVYVDNGIGTFAAPPGRFDTLVQNADGTFDLTLQNSRSRLHFSSDGVLQLLTDDYGNALTYTYDTTSGRLQRVSDSSGSGRYLDVTWGPNGRISAIADNSGRTVQYSYNTNGTLWSVTNAAGQTTTYTYVTGRYSPVLSQIQDHWGRVICDITWDAKGRLKSYMEEGETFTYTYNYNNVATQTAKQDAGGNTWIYPTGTDGLVVEKRPPAIAGAASSFTTYNADGTIQLATDEAGMKTSNTYFSQGRVASVTKDYQGTSAIRFDYAYDSNFPEKVVSIVPKNPTTNANDPNWQGWKYDYYATGSPAPGALFHVYRLHTDGTTADTMATYTYDTHGRVLSVTDALGAVTDYAYDATGNLQTVTAPSNNDGGMRPVTTYGYDAVGRVTSVTDPLGKTTTYTYDPLDRIATVTLPPPSIGSTLNFTTTYTYDNFDAPSGLTFTNVTDPNAIVTKQGYDQFGRLRKSIDGLSNATTYAYTRDLLTGITDANNNATTYQYDALKRLSATVFPNSAQESYTYYADGLMKTKTDRKNQTITYTYDAQKRLTRKAYPAGLIDYTYQGQKLTQVADTSVTPNETHTFGYDDRFRLTTNVQATRGTLTYTYDDADRTGSYTLTGGPSATYAYYPDGSLNTITWSPVTGTFKYTYNVRGQYQGITFPNGQSRSFSYDDQGRLLQLANTHPTAGNLATFNYGYDLDYPSNTFVRLGQRTSMTADVPALSWSGALTKYTYDANYQLTGSTYPNVTPFAGEVSSWTYDGIGNRTSATVNGTTTNYTYQKIGTNPLNWQRLTSAGTTSFTYDANGNTATMTGYTFGFDYENRVNSITGSAAASYKYDYQARRSSKTAGAMTSYVYDGLNLIRENSTDYLFGPGIDEPVAISTGGTVRYYSVDGLGSVTALSDSMGTTQNTYAYDGWGAPRSATEAVSQPFRYTARESGEVPSQWFYRARYYQSDLGRFLSEDPLGIDPDGDAPKPTPRAPGEEPTPTSRLASLHAYANNDPANFTDPSGLTGCNAAQIQRCMDGCNKGGKNYKDCTVYEIPCVARWTWCECHDRNKKCPPCPAAPFGPPQYHHVQNQHGCPNGHWHYWRWDQNPQTCKCYPKRLVGGCL